MSVIIHVIKFMRLYLKIKIYDIYLNILLLVKHITLS